MKAEQLFTTYFLPLYPEDARADLARARAVDANPAGNPAVLRHLDDAAETFVRLAPRVFEGGAPPELDFTDASVHRLSAALTPERIATWSSRGEMGSPDSELFNVVVHGAAYVGACVVRAHSAAWRVRRPLWESRVALTSRAGEAELAVFHWWLKSLAGEDGVTLADRYRTHVEVPRARPEDLPVFLVDAGSRALPRLKRPRYDVFYKYLKAHLPEVRDLGAHFPSPERFEELRFAWIEPHILGGGRLLLLAGMAEKGLHLFWIGVAGFEKSLFYPAETFPDPVIRAEGERIHVILVAAGATQTHELLWWGP